MNFVRRLYIYQKERFPLAILASTTTVVILSSIAVTFTSFSIYSFVAAFVSGILYLFHIRVVDERRDSVHDRTYHVSRPIPRGIISLQHLIILDGIGLGVFLALAFLFGKQALLFCFITVCYTFFAGNEFFIAEKIRSRFFVYNGINLVQMALLQLFMYSLFSTTWYESKTVCTHLVFVCLNAVVLEVLRKINTASEESVGHDTYSWHLGFQRSLFLLACTTLLSYGTFVFLIMRSAPTYTAVVISILFLVSLLVSIIRHSSKKAKITERSLYLTTFLFYVALNLIIYFTV